jgi:hypothetical protein
MDTCYIHLRRPWQYDRHTLYDGYANIYTFLKDEIKIKLTRLPLNEFNDRKEEFNLLGLSLAKEPFKDKTKLCLLRPVPKPPWKMLELILSLEYFGLINRSILESLLEDEQGNLDSRTSLFQPGENDKE